MSWELGVRSGGALMLRVLAAVVLGATSVAAQGVRGTVVDQASRQPIAGALVFLLDANDGMVGRDLTSETGAYRLSAPRPGTYRMRTMRIGFRPVVSAPVTLNEGPDVLLELSIEGVPVSLSAVKVERQANCPARQDASQAYNAWEQVTAALNAALLSSRVRGLSATIVGYDRWTEPASNVVLRLGANVKTGMSGQPWRAVPADSLHRAGFVVTDNTGSTYHAPDLDVLLSDVFLADHCLRFRGVEDGSLAIEFAPSRDRGRVAEIRGMVWLDATSLQLRRLQFRYVNVPAAVAEADAGGELEFLPLRNGKWVISKWEIRMPSAWKQDRGSAYGDLRATASVRLAEVKTTGGHLLNVVQDDDTLWALPPRTLRGRVLDSATARPLRGAAVILSGTSYSTQTDARGSFEIDNVLPGAYTVLIQTPDLDSVAALHKSALVFFEELGNVEIRVPGPSSFVRLWCPAIRENERSSTGVQLGMLMGTVFAHDSMRVPNAEIKLQWTEFRLLADGASSRPREMMVTTDSDGVYRACGVPIDQPIKLSTEFDGGSFPTEVRILSETRTRLYDIRLDRNRRRIMNARRAAHPDAAPDSSMTSVTSGHAPMRNGMPQ
jgi:hypothetical protein